MTVTHAYASPVVARRAWLGAGLALAAVGWGANQFAPLIVMYQSRLGLSAAVADAMFGLYALGLVPALLAGGRLSDQAGRRAVVMPALLASFLATCLLMAGGHLPLLLYVGRFLAGIASGLAFGSGVAWVKELSADAGDTAAGPRRATVAMTAGFAGGPLMAGVCAQWLPWPTVTAYLPHLAVLTAVAVQAWRTPDPGRADSASPVQAAEVARPRAVARHFLLVMLPFAPWVFGTAAIALAYLPALAAPRMGHQALLFSALATGLTALAGIAAQPLARATRRLPPGRLLPASMTQFAGLTEVQHVAAPGSLGTATAAYQVLSYAGFAFPLLMSLASSRSHWPPPDLLLLLIGVAATAAAWLAVGAVRQR
jgi:MFS family permease